MCGICGIVDLHGEAQDLKQAVDRMVESQVHRGPDGRDRTVQDVPGTDARVALGHNRLAILDPTPRGAQPMADPPGQTWITYNGEV